MAEGVSVSRPKFCTVQIIRPSDYRPLYHDAALPYPRTVCIGPKSCFGNPMDLYLLDASPQDKLLTTKVGGRTIISNTMLTDKDQVDFKIQLVSQ